MSDRTGISWCDATWNPVTGCTKVSEGCRFCYAETVAERFWREQYKGWPPGKLGYYAGALPRKFTDVLCHPDRLDQPLHWRKPRRIFVCSMGDLFHEDVWDEFINQVWNVAFNAPRHTYLFLTKRPQRLYDWTIAASRAKCWPVEDIWPDWMWLGVSCEDQATADERIPILLQTPAVKKFVSLEPLLGGVRLRQYLVETETFQNGAAIPRSKLDLIIVGGESGPKARPCDVAWIRSIVQQCQAAQVPCFVKQDSGLRSGMQGRIPDDLWLKEWPS